MFGSLYALLALLPMMPPVNPAVVRLPFEVKAPNVAGGTVKLVDREQLRTNAETKRVTLPKKMRLTLEGAIAPPATWDWSKGNSLTFPMLGNDRLGDCFYAAAAKKFIADNANSTGTAVTFNEALLEKRYLKLSGGDNGLSDDQIFPEMKSGVIGPNGPHKILDYAVIPAGDYAALDFCQWAFGSTLYTFSVPAATMNKAKPGAIWDTETGNDVGGHAMLGTGKNKAGRYMYQTWALNPPVELTTRFMDANDSEHIAVMGLEWFNDKGYAANGLHYTDAATLWTQLTGGKLPASTFPPPSPTPTPTPPTPAPAGVINLSMSDLTATAQAQLATAGVKTFALSIGYGANKLPDVPTVMPGATIFPAAWSPSCPGGVCPSCPGGVCPSSGSGQGTRWEPFGGIFRRR